jgi:HSP20 family molecular chaperone IbpA
MKNFATAFHTKKTLKERQMFNNRNSILSQGRNIRGNRRYFQQDEQTSSWANQMQHQHHCMMTPQTDILELDDQFILEIALPGVVLDDVELKVEENSLTVVAKRTLAMFEERAQILRKELSTGYLVREFHFDNEILHDQIEARLDRGILYVSVPKLDAAFRVPVSAGNIETQVQGVKTRVGKQENMRENMRKEVTIK